MRASDDDRLASLMSTLSDPESLLTIAQSMLRDAQTEGRQQDTETRQAAARIQEALRSDEITRSLTDAQQSKDSETIANVFKVVGAALSVVVGVLGSVFTGGASVVAAVGLVIALVGPLVCDALAEAKVLPSDVALGLGIGFAAVGAAMSFGAGAAGGAASVASQAAKAALEATKWSLRLTQATVSTVEAGFRAHAAMESADSSHHFAEATGAEARRELANQSADSSAQGLTGLLQTMARINERLREIRESRAETMSSITGALARA
ncbi:MAG: hypothetical protein K1X94_14820 [Sandaracinaceae bacterium]|nr:hypothetical protein [Sandaracinaceae bacterium]